MDPKKTGTIILDARKKLNMTQKDLADKLYVSDKAVSKWERGLCFPDISVLIPLTEILKISLYDLLRGERMNKSEIEETLKEDDYTISCEVVSVTGDVKMWFEGDDDSVYNKSLVVGVNTYTRKVSPQGATFGLIGNGASVTLKWVKLEKGSIATPFVPRLYAEELAMCQRYFRHLMIPENKPYYSTSYFSGISFQPHMRTNPSVYAQQFKETSTDITSDINLVSMNLYGIASFVFKSAHNVMSGSIKLDAEIY